MTTIAVFSVLLVAVCVGAIHGFVDEVDPYETRINNLETQVTQLQATLNQLQPKLAHLERPAVAFTANLSKTLSSLGSHQTIVFDQIISNDGHAYNNLDGHFTAPVAGVYAFFVTVTNIPHHSVSLYLMKNGHGTAARVLAHGTPGDSGMYVTSTIAIMLDLNQGDRVCAQNEGGYTGTVEELDGGWSYFSGHLIK